MTKHSAVFSETRGGYFRPSWFLSLFRGQLSLGDTFWAGTYGAIMLFVPVWVGIYMAVTIAAPDQIWVVQKAIYIFALVYTLLLLGATIRVARKSTTGGNWRWGAIVHNFGIAGMAVYLAWKMLL